MDRQRAELPDRRRDFAENTDADGQVKLVNKQDNGSYQWLVTATTDDGRLAYLGFTGIWGGQYYDPNTRRRSFTSSPIARSIGWETPPNSNSGSARRNTTSRELALRQQGVHCSCEQPKAEKVMEKTFTCDPFGGFDGEMPLPKDATLGDLSVLHTTGAEQHHRRRQLPRRGIQEAGI